MTTNTAHIYFRNLYSAARAAALIDAQGVERRRRPSRNVLVAQAARETREMLALR